MSLTFRLPDDQELLAAAGAVALTHTQLNYVLQMTVKSFLGMSVEAALYATDGQTTAQLRDSIKRLAKQRFPEEALRVRVNELLGKARIVSRKRNDLVHRLWAYKADGTPGVRDEDHSWGPLPTAAELIALANEIINVSRLLNDARLRGFLRDALEAYPEKKAPPAPNANAPVAPQVSTVATQAPGA